MNRPDLFQRAWKGLMLTSLLALTSPAPLWANAPPKSAIVGSFPMESRLPFTLSIKVPFENGRSLTLLIDTGTTYSLLSQAAAKAIGVRVRGGRGPYIAKTASGHELAFVVDRDSVNDRARDEAEYGLIGANFLQQFVVELDFAAQQVRWIDPALYQVDEGVTNRDEAVVAVSLQQGRPFADVRIGDIERPFLMALGIPPAAMIPSGAAKGLGIETRTLPKLAEMFLGLQKVESRLYDAETVRFAGFDLGPTPVMITARSYYPDSSDPAIGFDVLSQFSLRIDYARRRMWLRRNRSDQRHLGFHYGEARKAGVVLMKNDEQYRVYGVVPGSTAQALGLELGDTLVTPRFAGAPTPESVLAGIAAEKPVKVRRDDGRNTGDDVKLPDAATFDAAMEASSGDRALTAAESEQRQREEFQKKLAKRVYSKTASGWEVVEEYRVPRGPREGEEWITHAELMALEPGED